MIKAFSHSLTTQSVYFFIRVGNYVRKECHMPRIKNMILPTLFLILIVCPNLIADTALTGQVVSSSGQPVSNVNIQSDGIHNTVATDRNGNFEVSLKLLNFASKVFSLYEML